MDSGSGTSYSEGQIFAVMNDIYQEVFFMIITQTISSLMESIATHETLYYITVNPNEKNRSTEFNE
jgi:hypothetical protein